MPNTEIPTETHLICACGHVKMSHYDAEKVTAGGACSVYMCPCVKYDTDEMHYGTQEDAMVHYTDDNERFAYADEVRITDPNTGGQKGSKLVALAYIDPLALEELGKVAGKGAIKYDKFNYLKGYDWTLSANAALRHFMAFMRGETYDPETGCNHAAMFAWHGLCLTSFSERGLGNDDRYRPPSQWVELSHDA